MDNKIKFIITIYVLACAIYIILNMLLKSDMSFMGYGLLVLLCINIIIQYFVFWRD
jgi:O-antigen/teichoic acid export membrane protein